MMLPIDIMINIFLKLPVKSFLRCECVCKLWRNTINTPYFVERHRKRSDARESQLKIFTSCEKDFITIKIYEVNPDIDSNTFTLSRYPISELTYEPANAHFYKLGNGLFLVGAGARVSDSPGFLYNPIKRQKLNLPPPAINRLKFDMYSSAHGLCFDESSKQYKLVRVSSLLAGVYYLHTIKYATEVYTLGSNKWKQIAAVPPDRVYGTATPAYGDLHWVVGYWAVGQFLVKSERYLVSFEVTKEEFKVTPMPGGIDSSIFNWREELALVSQTPDTNTNCVRIWVLRDYDDNNNCRWEEVYALTFPMRLDWHNFATWGDDIVFDIGHMRLLVKNKIIGGDYCKLLHWNIKEGVVTPMVNESPTEAYPWQPPVLEMFTSYKFNLVSLRRSAYEDSDSN